MIEIVAAMTIPREDETRWDDKEYRRGVLTLLTEEIVRNISKRIEVRRIKDVGTKRMKVEARLLILERDSAMGGRRPITLADAEEKEPKAPGATPRNSVVDVAVRKIQMPGGK